MLYHSVPIPWYTVITVLYYRGCMYIYIIYLFESKNTMKKKMEKNGILGCGVHGWCAFPAGPSFTVLLWNMCTQTTLIQPPPTFILTYTPLVCTPLASLFMCTTICPMTPPNRWWFVRNVCVCSTSSCQGRRCLHLQLQWSVRRPHFCSPCYPCRLHARCAHLMDLMLHLLLFMCSSPLWLMCACLDWPAPVTAWSHLPVLNPLPHLSPHTYSRSLTCAHLSLNILHPDGLYKWIFVHGHNAPLNGCGGRGRTYCTRVLMGWWHHHRCHRCWGWCTMSVASTTHSLSSVSARVAVLLCSCVIRKVRGVALPGVITVVVSWPLMSHVSLEGEGVMVLPGCCLTPPSSPLLYPPLSSLSSLPSPPALRMLWVAGRSSSVEYPWRVRL